MDIVVIAKWSLARYVSAETRELCRAADRGVVEVHDGITCLAPLRS